MDLTLSKSPVCSAPVTMIRPIRTSQNIEPKKPVLEGVLFFILGAVLLIFGVVVPEFVILDVF